MDDILLNIKILKYLTILALITTLMLLLFNDTNYINVTLYASII